ncbi:hypothetical protein IMSHALPRED_008147 [Imshaugia aleurites]|uniref:RING-type domain-containing protein n=1 Tax=Imshaugia aleurites TaxID=172621 RepID=A0A8H3IR68_9LECA|nr:hypothetical protein IMSHALPRED_008147 [Imshaugia aleurites]
MASIINNATNITNSNDEAPDIPVSAATVATVACSIVAFFLVVLLIVAVGYLSSMRHPNTSPRMTQRPISGFQEKAKTTFLNKAVLEAMPVSMFTQARIAERSERDSTSLRSSLTHTNSAVSTKEKVSNNFQAKASGARSCVGQYNDVTAQTPDNLIASPEPAHGCPSAELHPQKVRVERWAATAGVTCLICLNDFIDGDLIRTLPCGHDFHPACIDPWLLDRSTACPACRLSFLPPRTIDINLDVAFAGDDTSNV